MDLTTLVKLGAKHARSAVAEWVRLHSNHDFTTPVNFIGLVNERCNIACRQCEFWRLADYKQEMSIEQWKDALLNIKDFVGSFYVMFTGGEPYLKNGFLDLLAFCAWNRVRCGLTTNGWCLTPNVARETVAARPLNVNVSIDAADAELCDYLRGRPGVFQHVIVGIENIRSEQGRQGIKFPVVIKATINRLNFRGMPRLVQWAKEIGATAVSFQPMSLWTPETREELWIGEGDLAALVDVSAQLIQMKHQGWPLLNSDSTLKLLSAHFANRSAPEQTRPCRVGMRNFWIDTNGDVKLCDTFGAVGNIKHQSAREIWYGQAACAVRQQILRCDKLCLLTCVAHKSLRDHVSAGRALLRN